MAVPVPPTVTAFVSGFNLPMVSRFNMHFTCLRSISGFFVKYFDPRSPISSALKAIKSILRFRFSRFASNFSIISRIAATPEALSSAPLWMAKVSGLWPERFRVHYPSKSQSQRQRPQNPTWQPSSQRRQPSPDQYRSSYGNTQDR